MTALQQLFAQLVRAIATSATAIFDKSFETKSFDGRPWKHRIPGNVKFPGALLMNSGNLRRSLKYNISGNTITWTSNLPYAKIHNDGGLITVTPKMKRFFWAMHYKYAKRVKRGKKGQVLKASLANNDIAEFYKRMALKKVGSRIWIRRRRFIGPSKEVDAKVKKIMDAFMKKLTDAIARQAKARAKS